MTTVEVAVALILHQGCCFVQRRDPGARHASGLWEFPGGKLEPLESPRVALFRELLEELRWIPARAQALKPIHHDYPEYSVVLHPFLCEGTASGRPRLETALAWGWFTPMELARLPIPAANRELLELIP
jgi:8-oxo-dGTP diphosphatase